MKKFLLTIVLLLPLYSNALEQYNFSKFETYQGITSAICEVECAIIIDKMQQYSNIYTKGEIEGSGTISYGFIIDEKIFIQKTGKIYGKQLINNTMADNEISSYGENAKFIMIFQGTLKSDNLEIETVSINFRNSIKRRRNEFRTMDVGYKPYTINLLRSPTIFGNSANIYFYVFLIGILVFLSIFYGKDKKRILYAGMSIMIFRIMYSIRMDIETINYYRIDYLQYIKPANNKTYRDRNDLHSFLYFSKEKLEDLGINKSEKIAFISSQYHVFLNLVQYMFYPFNNIEKNNYNGKYFIIYAPDTIDQKENNLIINGYNIGTGELYKFSDHAFIFIKQ